MFQMKNLIIFIILLSSVFTFAEEDYTKDIWHCKVSESCELSDYTGDYTKNCKKYNDNRGFPIYWEYAYDKYGNSLFCDKPAFSASAKKICTKIINSYTDKNSYGKDILLIMGEQADYIFGVIDQSYRYLNIIYHTKTSSIKFSHTLCQPLYLDF
jgi:hypothetical protein